MNKVVNIFSGVVLVLFSIFVMAVIYDFSFSNLSLKGLAYKLEISGAFALLILLLGILRIKRRWQGAHDMRNFKSFHYSSNVARPALNLSLVFTIVEAIFMVVAILFFARLAQIDPEYVLPMMVVIALLLVDTVIFATKIGRGGEAFRIGIDKKAVAYFNREMHIFYFTGLTRIEMHQDMINFQYKEDLNIFLPLEILRKEDIVPFRDALIMTIEKHVNNEEKGKIIYIDDAFRTLE